MDIILCTPGISRLIQTVKFYMTVTIMFQTLMEAGVMTR